MVELGCSIASFITTLFATFFCECSCAPLEHQSASWLYSLADFQGRRQRLSAEYPCDSNTCFIAIKSRSRNAAGHRSAF